MQFAQALDFEHVTAIPLSALKGKAHGLGRERPLGGQGPLEVACGCKKDQYYVLEYDTLRCLFRMQQTVAL